ncbi:MAG: SHD1 domain-containing protein [Verrucomicrobiota bacterium]
MKSIKLLASLVTLYLVGGLPLAVAQPKNLRVWTDVSGRQITARLVEVTPDNSVRIERDDGQSFTVPLSRFSQADRDYVQAATAPSDPAKMADAAEEHWKRLRLAGSHPASSYADTALTEIIAEINQRLRIKKVTTEQGETVSIRTEPAELADQLKISGQMSAMDTGDFLKRIAYNYQLAVKVDALGGLVLVDKNAGGPGSFFGVDVK